MSEEKKLKYNEELVLQRALAFIKGTYSRHYAGQNDMQTVDVWDALGSAETTCRDTAIKYLMRFGKKKGYNPDDLYKAIQYIAFLYHFTILKKEAVPDPHLKNIGDQLLKQSYEAISVKHVSQADVLDGKFTNLDSIYLDSERTGEDR